MPAPRARKGSRSVRRRKHRTVRTHPGLSNSATRTVRHLCGQLPISITAPLGNQPGDNHLAATHPRNCGRPQQNPTRTQAQSAAGGPRTSGLRPLALVATFVAFIRPFRHQLSQYKRLPSAPFRDKTQYLQILDRRSLADAVLSSTINHNAITPMFLTGCERICDLWFRKQF